MRYLCLALLIAGCTKYPAKYQKYCMVDDCAHAAELFKQDKCRLYCADTGFRHYRFHYESPDETKCECWNSRSEVGMDVVE